MKHPELNTKLDQIEARLGYTFQDKSLLISSFVHRSYINENKDFPYQDNERLEFLGDSVLNLIVAEYLYQTLPDESEGKLSSLRAHAVSSQACTRFFELLELQEFMLIGRGEELQAGRGGRSSIVADMFEALLGALYLDGGLAHARSFFLSHFTDLLGNMCHSPEQNWKAMLQEYTQKRVQKIPTYRLLRESGPDHARLFEIGVYIDEECIGQGEGATKKEAERQAAKCALDILQNKSEGAL